ncbi:MAG: hypothetical protein KIG53_04515 [Oscillospiraceae bacterium]|nr:hypothetical protein [Oscillospiraceae bacterium]
MSKAQPHPVSSVSNLSGASQFIYDEAGQLGTGQGDGLSRIKIDSLVPCFYV